MKEGTPYSLSCPIPRSEYDQILIAHGGGGKLSQHLIDQLFRPALGNEILDQGHDGAFLNMKRKQLAFTTDSFVVDPVFFPGGNVGDLAINGTVNDLSCCAAIPRYLSLGLILEEGLPISELWEILLSIRKAADHSGVKIVTGDTKVVEKGKGDRVFINTSGIGEVIEGTEIGPRKCRPGDVVLLSGSIAEHGICILSQREGLNFSPPVQSDTCSLSAMLNELMHKCKEVHVLRDPTRGGIASALNEIASSSQTGIAIFEKEILIRDSVRGACEILGLDPLYIANEGKALVILPEKEADRALGIMQTFEEGAEARIIGRVIEESPGIVRMQTLIGSTRIVDMITGEQLPRIC